MKKQILICAIILSGICFCAIAEQKTSGGLPHLNMSQESWDAGTIVQGEVVTKTFILTNAGEADLSINKVRPSCGCLAVFTFNPRLSPGQSTELKATFDSKGLKGDFEKYIYIESNDPDAPHKVVTITGRAEVLPRISILIEPRSWNFVSSLPEQPSIFKFAIENRGKDTLRITSIEASSGLMDASISSAQIKSRKASVVSLKLKPKAEILEAGEEYISLKIDIPIRYTNDD